MNYTKYFLKAKTKITKYGGTVVIHRKSEDKIYNPSTNQYESTDLVITGKAIQSSYRDDMVNGTTILATDTKLMCTFDEAPKITDVVEFGGKSYNIINISELNPNGNCVIYYDLQVR